MDDTNAGGDPRQADLALSDDDLEGVVGGIRQPRGPAKLKALAHRSAIRDPLSHPAKPQFATEVDHD